MGRTLITWVGCGLIAWEAGLFWIDGLLYPSILQDRCFGILGRNSIFDFDDYRI